MENITDVEAAVATAYQTDEAIACAQNAIFGAMEPHIVAVAKLCGTHIPADYYATDRWQWTHGDSHVRIAGTHVKYLSGGTLHSDTNRRGAGKYPHGIDAKGAPILIRDMIESLSAMDAEKRLELEDTRRILASIERAHDQIDA